MAHGPGGDGRFPRTSVGLLARMTARPADGPAAWEEFCRRYHRPLMVFALMERRLPLPDAEDAVQSFFGWLMEEPRLEAFDPELGRFRSWLLLLFKRYQKDLAAGEKALKRGGGWERVAGVEERAGEYAARGLDPAAAYAREWALAAVREAIRGCGEALEGDGEGLGWLRARYAEPLDGGGRRPGKGDVAARLGMSEAGAAACDRRVKALLRGALERAARADVPDSGPASAVREGEAIRELLDALGG